MAMSPSRFERVRWDSFEENACSPPLPGSFRGLVLAAPLLVSAGEDAILPVAGAFQLGARFLCRFKSMPNEITLVAVNAATHAPCCANLLRDGYLAEPSGFSPSNPHLDRIVVAGHFNVDLFQWMTDLPRSPARYHVFATIGDVVSNVVTIEVGAAS
jgi:hypothetical protein